jgi:hypothetical protein
MLGFGTRRLPVAVWRLTADSGRVLIEVRDDIPGAPVAGKPTQAMSAAGA